MFRDLKRVAMASLFSSIEEMHCDSCDEFVKFKIVERRREKVRTFSFLEFTFAQYLLDFECPQCSRVCASFRGNEMPKVEMQDND